MRQYILLLAAGASLAATASPAVDARVSRQSPYAPSRCDRSARLGTTSKKIAAVAKAGRIPLAFGVVTGMSKDEVRAINPQLLKEFSSQRYDFLGIPVSAGVSFDEREAFAVSVYINPKQSQFEPILAALNEHYGRPFDLGTYLARVDVPHSSPGISRSYEAKHYLWCDDARRIELNSNEDSFSLRISPAVQ